jgi:Putative amidoligase enzyme
MHPTTLNRIIDNDGADLEGCFMEWMNSKKRFGHRKNKETNLGMNNTKLLRNKWYARAMGVSEETLNRYKLNIMEKRGNVYQNPIARFRNLTRQPAYRPDIEERFMEANKGELVSVELECVFRDKTDIPRQNYLGRHFVNIDDDGSVHYRERDNDSDGDEDGEDSCDIEHGSAEVKVTFRHEKPIRLKGVVDKLGRANAEINTTCGMHIHLDQRGVSQAMASKRARRLIKALPALAKIVAPSRLGNHYCQLNDPIKLGQTYRHSYNRYRAINFTSAYRKHKTLEVRLHGGTLDFWKIIGWVDLCHFITRSSAIDKVAEQNALKIRANNQRDPENGFESERVQITIEDLIRLEELPSHLRLYVWKRFRQFHPAEANALREKLVSEDKYSLTDGMAIS